MVPPGGVDPPCTALHSAQAGETWWPLDGGGGRVWAGGSAVPAVRPRAAAINASQAELGPAAWQQVGNRHQTQQEINIQGGCWGRGPGRVLLEDGGGLLEIKQEQFLAVDTEYEVELDITKVIHALYCEQCSTVFHYPRCCRYNLCTGI